MQARRKIRPEPVDPTNTDLALALLDQRIAGQFQGRRYAYVAVVLDDEVAKTDLDRKNCFGLGVAEFDKRGFWPVPAKVFAAGTFDDASDIAAGMNIHIGLSEMDSTEIVCSSMRKGVDRREFDSD